MWQLQKAYLETRQRRFLHEKEEAAEKNEELCDCGWLSRPMDDATSRQKAIAAHVAHVKAAHRSELRTSLSREEQEAAQLRHVATLQVAHQEEEKGLDFRFCPFSTVDDGEIQDDEGMMKQKVLSVLLSESCERCLELVRNGGILLAEQGQRRGPSRSRMSPCSLFKL